MVPTFVVRRTADFSGWLDALESPVVRAAILTRLARLGLGNPGDVKPVGSGVSELRIDIGPGYRAYYVRVGSRTYLIQGGGDKSSQVKDIERAIALANDLRAVSRAKQRRKQK
jgi:putative addiction module killer protein